MVLDAEQPAAVLPVTVYVVLIVGVAVIVAPVIAPGFQVYVEAPLAINETVLPEQTSVEDAVTFIVGVGLTFKFKVLVAEHPAAFFPVTVY